ncbi:MAG: hypothetical protein GY746_01810, partial [Gammaproteobacteria bacterium]|nr:hypothetical protein [Gammaproteobacteria bacterium]
MKTGKVIGFVVFGVLVTIYAVRFYNLLPDKPHKYKVIPPLVLEDGSVEHTLISYSYNPRKPDLTWVLRFPKELLVDRPEDSYKHTPNTNLSLYFKLPDFSMNVGSAGKTIGDEDGLIVYLTSIITRYGSGFFHYQKRPYDSDSSFSGMRSERFKFNCRAVAEVYPNIFLLRNL